MTRFYLLLALLLVLLAFVGCGTSRAIVPAYSAAYYLHEVPQPTLTPSPTQPPQAPAPTVEPRPFPCALDLADEWIAQMTVREQIGQLIMPRLPWQTTQLTPALTQWLHDYPVGGIILFSDNVSTIQQVQALTHDLQDASGIPLFIATDEEGGRVSRVGRLFDNSDFPIRPALEIGRTNDKKLAYLTGRAIGEQLRYLDINMNFAPVADVWTNPANTVIGNRAFSEDPAHASIMVDYTIQGLHSAEVMAVVKHFPGHGDTYEDSHFHQTTYPHDRDRFDSVEALPFIGGIAAGADGVMIGHIATPQLQNPTAPLDWMQPWLEAGTLPATFSDFWLQDVLRGEMGFQGLIITDALDMRAISDHFTPQQVAVGAFVAGADILLMPTDITATFDALLTALEDGVFDEARLHESLRRIFLAKIGL